jgi:phosphoglycolate phosphatase-like HAD superfamily hydrolase
MTARPIYAQQDLAGLKPRHATFVGIDSDGCVFDTMESKQKRCFHPVTIRLWLLEKIENEAREVLEFVNLYSRWRGTNRFLAQITSFELLREHPEVKAAGVTVPALTALKAWTDSGAALANSELEKAVAASGDPELALVLRWSREVNEAIARTVTNVPAFKWAVEGLSRIHQHSDAICVSQTPHEALMREWSEHGLLDRVSAVAGQELGTKADHLRLAAGGKYPADRTLKIGDAMGDLSAAKANRVLFYPILPQREEESWERFCKEAYDRLPHVRGRLRAHAH